MKKKVLIISYYWPPSGGSGVQRWLKFVKYLPQFGWDPVVYTVEDGEFPVIDNSLLKEIPEGVQIIKQPIWEPFGIYKKITGKKKTEQFGHGFAGEKSLKGFKKLFGDFAIWVRGNFFIPDARKFWIKPSVKYLSSFLKENNIEYLITTGPPHSLHVIGLELKRTNRIKWVADFRDPWTGVYYFPELKLSQSSVLKHKLLEKQVLDNADRIIAVGKTLRENLIALAGKSFASDKIKVITNGYDHKLESIPCQPEKFNLVYTGLFSKDQNHLVLWEAINQCCKMNNDFDRAFSMDLYGKIDSTIINSIHQLQLDDKLNLHAHKSLKEIGEVQRSSAILLLCINHYPGEKEMLTGKLFDYISSQRPILNIGPIDGDAAEIIRFTKTGNTFAIDDKDGIAHFLLEKFTEFKKGKLKTHPENIENFHRKELTRDLVSILEGI